MGAKCRDWGIIVVSLKGIVSTLCDPTVGAVIGADWCASIKALGADAIKVPVTCAADGNLPTSLYRRGLDVAHIAGLPVLSLLTRGFVPVGKETPTLYPNMPLNVPHQGNPTLSPFVDAWSLRAEGLARHLAPHGAIDWVCWNEPNLHALLQQGTNTDPTTDKAHALNPAVFASLCYQTARRLKTVGARRVYCGALSLLPMTGLDAANGYYAAYVEAFYHFLASVGIHGPYPFDGFLVNTEGIWPPGHFAAAIAVLRGIMTKHGDAGEIIVGEHGVTNAALPAQAATYGASYAQMRGTVNTAYLFQHHGRDPYLGPPNLYGGWGCTQFRVNGASLVPGADYKMASVARSLFSLTP